MSDPVVHGENAGTPIPITEIDDGATKRLAVDAKLTSGFVAEVNLDKANDEVLVYGSSVSDNSDAGPADASRWAILVDGSGQLILHNGDVITGSSTAASVAGSGTFTGTEFSTLNYGHIHVHVNESQSGTLNVSNRDASSNVVRVSTFATVGGTPFFIALTELDSRMLISWANGSGSPSTGQIETVGKFTPSSPTQTRLDAPLVPASIVTSTKNMERYVATPGTPTSTTVVTSGSSTLIAANTTNRLGFTISHTSGTGDVFIRYDGTAPTSTVYTDRIQPGETLSVMGKGVTTGAIAALASASSTVVAATEFTF